MNQKVDSFNHKTMEYYDRVSEYYDNDCEEIRFEPYFKQIEKINTIAILEKYVREGCHVLDCAAGPGTYIDFILEKKASVVASDLSARHVQLLKKKYNEKVVIYQDNVMDLSRHKNEIFDVILCCGPLYHLNYEDSIKCVKECINKLKPNGILVLAYINKHFTGLDLMFSDRYVTNFDDAIKMLKEGVAPNREGFFGCARFVSPEEIESMIINLPVNIKEHVTVDSDVPFFFKNMVDFNKEKIMEIAEYVRKIGSKRTMLGSGKHNLLILEKKV